VQPPLRRDVDQLHGVGPRLAERLARLNIHSIQDLLFHLPLRYQDRTQATPIGALQEGTEAVITGEVLLCDTVVGRRRSLLCRISDGTGVTSLRFFHFSKAQQTQLRKGVQLRCFGAVRRGMTGLEFYHPEYTLIDRQQPSSPPQTLTPVYPTTEGISQQKLRQLTQQALERMAQAGGLADLLPSDAWQTPSDRSLAETIAFLHFPPAAEVSTAAKGLLEQRRHPLQQKLILEELVAHQLSMLSARRNMQAATAPPFPCDNALADQLLKALPFPLTQAQQRVIKEITDDLNRNKPMLRLLQGDVGSGKTLVAAVVATQAVAAGYQVAIMAPTELLAEQHLQNFRHWMTPLSVTIAWLSGKQTAKQRSTQQAQIERGSANIVIGTHALFQKSIQFDRLGLVIIDEQHRFGVHQRLALREKGALAGQVPHQLIMTATPIPRTLAMCAYADLDISTIDQLPPGRQPITTLVVSESRRQQVIDRVHKACLQGRQVYWVCTLIEASETLQCQAAEATAERLKQALPECHIGLVHGRLKADQKTTVMQAFAAAEIQLLVATTVIEVGVASWR